MSLEPPAQLTSRNGIPHSKVEGNQSQPERGSIEHQEEGPITLSPGEQWWRAQYDWLLGAGYRLRSRYRPGWKPSWVGTKRSFYHAEDSLASFNSRITYAIDLSTGQFVALKKVEQALFINELPVTETVSEEPLKSDKRNHSIQCLKILYHPSERTVAILVLPLLRSFDDPPFETVGEILDFVWQLFEGLAFLHEHRIVHGDISRGNIMLDASELYPDGFHPIEPGRNPTFSGRAVQKYTRTERPPKYYLIDFGASQRFYEDEDHLSDQMIGTDLSVPEWREGHNELFDPFPVDVYVSGNFVKAEIVKGGDRWVTPGYKGFGFLGPLVDDMTKDDPESRPTMPEVLERYEKILKSLKCGQLRSRCREKPMFDGDEEPVLATAIIGVVHGYKQLSYVCRRLPPIPRR